MPRSLDKATSLTTGEGLGKQVGPVPLATTEVEKSNSSIFPLFQYTRSSCPQVVNNCISINIHLYRIIIKIETSPL